MKTKTFSFLYSFVTVAAILLGVRISVHAQNATDSLHYYYDLSVNPKQSNDLTRTYEFYKRHMEESLKKKDTASAIYDLRIIANIQNNLGMLYESEKTVVQALKLLNQNGIVKNRYATTGLYNELGMIHRALYNYDKALMFYEKALAASATSEDSLKVLNNVAFTYSKQGKHDLAQIQYEKVYETSLKQNDTVMIARALNNLGSEQAKLDQPEGIKNMLKALALRKKINDSKSLYSSHKHLAQYYYAQQIEDSATHYAKEAYRLSKSINSLTFIEDALSNLMLLKRDPFIMEYVTIKDSIIKTKQLQENKFAEMQYNYSEYQRKAQQSQLAASEQRTKTLAYQFAGLVLILMGIFFYIILRSRHKKENLLKVYETETRISKKVHDEVANDIYQMMTKLQTSQASNEPIMDDLEHIYIKTRDISKENSDIIHEDFKMQLEDLLGSYQNKDTNVILKNLNGIDWTLVSDAKKTTIYRVLQELMTNMKKHSKASLVVLTFEQEKKKLHITYKDNGAGTHLHKGSGCNNMENRIASVEGIINFESEPGSGFKTSLSV